MRPHERLAELAPVLILTLLLLTAVFSCAHYFETVSPSSYAAATIETLGFAWDFVSRPKILVKIVPNRSLSLWRESFIVDAHDSIMRWKSCIAMFTSKYGFSQLGMLSFEIYLDGVNASSTVAYDVTLRWVEGFPNDNVVGQTILVSEPAGKLNTATINVALRGIVSRTPRYLDDADIQAIVAEEFGHVLGLGHADWPNDLMAGFGALEENDLCHSTLDIYGLAIVYAYLESGIFKPPQNARISLQGTGIPYAHLDG